jgi:cytochrome b561
MANDISIRRYDRVAIALHWLVAVGVFVMIGLGWYMTEIPKGTPARAFYFNLHKSIGLTVGMIVLIRIAWRWTHKPPRLPAGTALALRAADVPEQAASTAARTIGPRVRVRRFIGVTRRSRMCRDD